MQTGTGKGSADLQQDEQSFGGSMARPRRGHSREHQPLDSWVAPGLLTNPVEGSSKTTQAGHLSYSQLTGPGGQQGEERQMARDMWPQGQTTLGRESGGGYWRGWDAT